jgi:hypothetical protein
MAISDRERQLREGIIEAVTHLNNCEDRVKEAEGEVVKWKELQIKRQTACVNAKASLDSALAKYNQYRTPVVDADDLRAETMVKSLDIDT